MRTIVTRTLASVLAALLAVSCGTVKESRQPDIEGRVFLPRVPRAVTIPLVEELELRRAIEELLPSVNVEEARAELRRMVADPRFHGRRHEELRVVLASWGSGPVALEEIGRESRAWCAAVRRTNCHERPLTDSSIYEIGFDFAMGSQWDGFAVEGCRPTRRQRINPGWAIPLSPSGRLPARQSAAEGTERWIPRPVW
jgi:hypothetical protein